LSTVIQLPERPNLEWLKKRARELARERSVKLSEAQFELARTYGFPSWPKLKAHVEMVSALTREPDAVDAESFLALVCLTYGDDHPSRVARGVAMAPTEPSDIWEAAAMGRLREVDDPSAQGGPFAWEPLLYLCYSRMPMSEADALRTATALLDAGADPNVGYLWHGLATPFTALTGVLGGGEGDQPPHQHWQPLARLLLERGANANDAQSLYNRQFRPDNEHLDLLFAFGLGQGDGGPWQSRMGAQMETPTQMVQHQLRWAIHHDMLERVQLMADNGVDVTTPFDQYPAWAAGANAKTPIEFAAMCGHTRIVDELAARGASMPWTSPVDQYIGSILAGREPAGDTSVQRTAHEQRPSLVVQAAATGRLEAVRGAVKHGFDVNALGRADAPVEQPWQTALHTAVERDDQAMIDLLLQLGADPSIHDARFHATPAGWAAHFGHDDVAARLTALSEKPQ
jgi:ankyrin repeat protein